MKANDLVAMLTKKIGKRAKYDWPVWVGREPFENPPRRLDAVALEALEHLRESINQVIPNDFSYNVRFDKDSYFFCLFYSDGAAVTTIVPLKFTVDLDDLERLKGIDWDIARNEVIKKGELLERVCRMNWLHEGESPTNCLRIRHREFVEQFEADPVIAGTRFALFACYETFMCFGTDGGFESRVFQKEEHLIDDIYNMLATERFVLAAKVEGRWLSAPEIDSLCAESRLGLGPISRSIAEGRYEELMDVDFLE